MLALAMGYCNSHETKLSKPCVVLCAWVCVVPPVGSHKRRKPRRVRTVPGGLVSPSLLPFIPTNNLNAPLGCLQDGVRITHVFSNLFLPPPREDRRLRAKKVPCLCTHTTVFHVSVSQCANISDVLNTTTNSAVSCYNATWRYSKPTGAERGRVT
jgi:hypothetical protein